MGRRRNLKVGCDFEDVSFLYITAGQNLLVIGRSDFSWKMDFWVGICLANDSFLESEIRQGESEAVIIAADEWLLGFTGFLIVFHDFVETSSFCFHHMEGFEYSAYEFVSSFRKDIADQFFFFEILSSEQGTGRGDFESILENIELNLGTENEIVSMGESVDDAFEKSTIRE